MLKSGWMMNPIQERSRLSFGSTNVAWLLGLSRSWSEKLYTVLKCAKSWVWSRSSVESRRRRKRSSVIATTPGTARKFSVISRTVAAMLGRKVTANASSSGASM